MFSAALLLASLTTATAADDVVTGPDASEAWVASINRKWRGVGIGVDSGMWGSDYASGLKVDVPFCRKVGQFLGVRVRTVTVFTNNASGAFSPTNIGAFELFGRGPVMLGILRVYGGGGLFVGIDESHQPAVGGGGHYGLEVLAAPRMSFTFEIGGQGGPGALDIVDGASVTAGLMVYLGDLGKR